MLQKLTGLTFNSADISFSFDHMIGAETYWVYVKSPNFGNGNVYPLQPITALATDVPRKVTKKIEELNCSSSCKDPLPPGPYEIGVQYESKEGPSDFATCPIKLSPAQVAYLEEFRNGPPAKVPPLPKAEAEVLKTVNARLQKLELGHETVMKDIEKANALEALRAECEAVKGAVASSATNAAESIKKLEERVAQAETKFQNATSKSTLDVDEAREMLEKVFGKLASDFKEQQKQELDRVSNQIKASDDACKATLAEIRKELDAQKEALATEAKQREAIATTVEDWKKSLDERFAGMEKTNERLIGVHEKTLTTLEGINKKLSAPKPAETPKAEKPGVVQNIKDTSTPTRVLAAVVVLLLGLLLWNLWPKNGGVKMASAGGLPAANAIGTVSPVIDEAARKAAVEQALRANDAIKERDEAKTAASVATWALVREQAIPKILINGPVGDGNSIIATPGSVSHVNSGVCPKLPDYNNVQVVSYTPPQQTQWYQHN